MLQLNIPLVTLSDHCTMLTESGDVVDNELENRMEFHFGAMLDQVAEWKKATESDASLLGQFHCCYLCIMWRLRRALHCVIGIIS